MEVLPDPSGLSILLIGFALGLHHAVEGDHLAAVSTIVSEKKNLLMASAVGGFWGIGHTISLFTAGSLAIFLKLQISQTLEKRLEAAVGVMLVILGLNALRRLLKAGRIHVHTHDHDGRRHIHIHTHGDPTSEPSHHRFSTRSMAVGMVHGLAGSAALMLLLVPAIPTPAVAILYILVFGVGSICGMMAMSFLMSLPFHFTASRSMGLNVAIRLCAGVFSLSLGAAIVYDKIG